MPIDANQPNRGDVLDLFAGDGEVPSRERLQEFIAKYPQFQRELVDYALARAEEEALPEPAPLSQEAEARIASRTLSFVSSQLFEREQAAVPAVAATTEPRAEQSLSQLARAASLNLGTLAGACRLDAAIVSKLNSRQISYSTIPARLVRMLAERLGVAAEVVASCFDGPPQLATGRAFLARGKPEAGAQQAFADAVESSSVSPEDKAFWREAS